MHTWDPSSDMSSALMPARPEAEPLELDTAAIVPITSPVEEESSGSRGLAALWDDLDVLDEAERHAASSFESVLDAATMDPESEWEDEEDEPWLEPDDAPPVREEATSSLRPVRAAPEEYTVELSASVPGAPAPAADADVDLFELPTSALTPIH